MVRRILVPLDPSPFAKAAREYAFEIAREHKAEVTALGVLDTPAIRESVGHTTPGAMHFAKKAEDRRESEAQDRLQEMLTGFAERAEKVGVSHSEQMVQGSPVDVIIHEAMYYDVLVLGLKTHYHFETSDEPDDALGKMVGRLATPLLVVPEDFTSLHDTNVLIAYDGSFSATRSLRQFATLAVFSDPRIVLLTSSEDREESERLQSKAVAYLKAYDFNHVEADWTPKDISAAIREDYVEDIDLIVLGTHAKKSWFDFASIGSLATYLMEESTRPLFIGQ